MPVNNAYVRGVTLFSRASKEDLVRHKNNINSLNVDDDTREQLRHRGICSGITSTWLTMFLNNMGEARDPTSFKETFDVIRFQGAYLKELHGKAPQHIAALRQMTDPRVEELSTETGRAVSEIPRPQATPWAAYVSSWGHATGIGYDGNSYYFMDPNFGLFTYDSVDNFLTDFQQFVETRARRKNQPENAEVTCIFYKGD